MNSKALSSLQDYLNVLLFDGKLKKIPIRFRKIHREDRALGYYQFELKTGAPLEIVLESRQKYCPFHFILVHEMVHQWENQILGYVRGRGNKVHNKRFKRKLASLHKKLGWKLPPSWSMRG